MTVLEEIVSTPAPAGAAGSQLGSGRQDEQTTNATGNGTGMHATTTVAAPTSMMSNTSSTSSSTTATAISTVRVRRIKFPLQQDLEENEQVNAEEEEVEGGNVKEQNDNDNDDENDDSEIIAQAFSLHRSIYPFSIHNRIYSEDEYVTYISSICQPSNYDRKGAAMFVVELNRRLLGMCLIHLDYTVSQGHILRILDIVVHERWRGRKIGTRLFLAAVEFGLQHKMKHIKVDIPTTLPRAQTFFSRLGLLVKSFTFGQHISESSSTVISPAEAVQQSCRWQTANPTICRIVIIDAESAETSEHSMLLSSAHKIFLDLHPQIGDDVPRYMQKVLKGLKRNPSFVAIALSPDGDLDHLDQYKPPEVLGIANFQYTQTYQGRQLHINDLIVATTSRHCGVGSALLTHLRVIAKSTACNYITFDASNNQTGAHQFCWKQKMLMEDFQFSAEMFESTQHLDSLNAIISNT